MGIRYYASGISDGVTYAGLPAVEDPKKGTDYAILGIPFDIRTSYRPGTRLGPEGIREAYCHDSYDDALGIDAADYVKGIDCGNLSMINAEKAYLGMIPDAIYKLLEQDIIPIVLGGDHAITFPELLGYKKKYGKVSLIHFDSHTDTWESDPDPVKKHHDHATPFRRALEYEAIDGKTSIQIGMRGGLGDGPELFQFADSYGLTHVSAVNIHHMGMEKAAEMIREKVKGTKVFMTFDIDFIDPAYAPGTGTPVPGGFTSREAIELLRHILPGLDMVGFDIVEVAPNYDANGITAELASRIVQEYITSIACRKAGITEYARKGMTCPE